MTTALLKKKKSNPDLVGQSPYTDFVVLLRTKIFAKYTFNRFNCQLLKLPQQNIFLCDLMKTATFLTLKTTWRDRVHGPTLEVKQGQLRRRCGQNPHSFHETL